MPHLQMADASRERRNPPRILARRSWARAPSLGAPAKLPTVESGPRVSWASTSQEERYAAAITSRLRARDPSRRLRNEALLTTGLFCDAAAPTIARARSLLPFGEAPDCAPEGRRSECPRRSQRPRTESAAPKLDVRAPTCVRRNRSDGGARVAKEGALIHHDGAPRGRRRAQNHGERGIRQGRRWRPGEHRLSICVRRLKRATRSRRVDTDHGHASAREARSRPQRHRGERPRRLRSHLREA